ncbi:MAG: DUF3604 domain-containing protein [Planctomycetes bacterium]|nr:DUF3604 domain-containing protein [Planctomycetota bacterium]
MKTKRATKEFNLYWGDMHTQFKPQWCKGDWDEFLEQSFRDAREYLDFYPIVYYPADYYNTKEGLKVESVGWRDEYQPEWEKICKLVKKHHKPGKFVTFAGYEWTGDRTRWGDHNVFYPDDDPPLDLSMTIDELYENLRKLNGIAIPHHSGYAPGQRSKDWDHYDEDISPFAEVLSGHGSSEGCNTPLKLDTNPSMGPRVTGNTVQDGLAKGCRVGIMASGDNGGGFAGKHGTGLMACYAKDLTREAIWEAFLARRVYGVTGDRIQLALWANNHFMGDVFRSKGPVRIRADVTGTQAIDRIELIKNNRVVATHCHQGSWDIPKKGKVRVKIQIEHGWGPSAHYGFKVSQKVWDVTVQAGTGAKIVSAEGCFARTGQKIKRVTGTKCTYRVITAPRAGGNSPFLRQSVIIEIEGKLDSKVKFTCDEIAETFTLKELMEKSRLLTMRKQVIANVKKQFGLTPDQIENPEDVLFHNSYKIKMHQAIPEKGFTASPMTS